MPAFAYVSDTKTPQGILAVVRQMEYGFADITGEREREKGTYPCTGQSAGSGDTLGTIFRTAEAAGATGILLSSDCVDIYNPKCEFALRWEPSVEFLFIMQKICLQRLQR